MKKRTGTKCYRTSVGNVTNRSEPEVVKPTSGTEESTEEEPEVPEDEIQQDLTATAENKKAEGRRGSAE